MQQLQPDPWQPVPGGNYVAFRDAKLSDLFHDFKLTDPMDQPPGRTTILHGPGEGMVILHRGMIFPAFKTCHAKPTDAVIKYLREAMLAIPNDTISFRLTMRDDGSVLVSARYSTILGSRWLAIIDAEDLP